MPGPAHPLPSPVVTADLLSGRRIAPSILASDFARLGAQVEQVMDAGARVIHVDVMDGHFVPPISIGALIVDALDEQVHEAKGQVATLQHEAAAAAKIENRFRGRAIEPEPFHIVEMAREPALDIGVLGVILRRLRVTPLNFAQPYVVDLAQKGRDRFLHDWSRP